MFGAAIYTDFLMCWLCQSCSFGKQCAGKKGYTASISTSYHPSTEERTTKKYVCLRFPAAACTDSNASHHKAWNRMKKNKKKKKKQGSFYSTQKQLYLVCNDGLQHRLNRHVHNGYLMEFQSEWAQLRVV